LINFAKDKTHTVMKKIYIFLILTALMACKKNEESNVKEIRVQNPVVQAFLIESYDKNHDGKLSEEEALEVITISAAGSQQDIDGLEKFPNLETLYVPRGQFRQLDVSKNLKLRQLFCEDGKFSTIDVSKNIELECLDCSSGEVSSIIFGNHPKFFYLACSDNRFWFLNLRSLQSMITLSCGNNPLKSLILPENSELNQLWCSGNSLSNLDLSSCPELRRIDCSSNSLTELDLSNNLNLYFVESRSNSDLHTLYLKTDQIVQFINKDAHTAIVYQ
jgi:hypothetical protein